MACALSIRPAALAAALLALGLPAVGLTAAGATTIGLPRVSVSAVVIAPLAVVTGLNNGAEIVGNDHVDGLDSPFRTGTDGLGVQGVAGVGTGDAAAINDDGVVVGNLGTPDDLLNGNDMRAFMAPRGASAPVDLGTLGGSRSAATGVNRPGEVVGWSTTAGSNFEHAFITDATGLNMRDLGLLDGSCAAANAINDRGQVAGFACAAGDTQTHAFVTGAHGQGLRDLGTLGGANSTALAINLRGVAVGWSDTASGARHAFSTGPGGRGLRDLDPGTAGSQAVAVNARGHVVGTYLLPDGSPRAFIAAASHGRFIDLNRFVTLPDGAILLGAVAINNHDQIVAYASDGMTYLVSRVFEANDTGL